MEHHLPYRIFKELIRKDHEFFVRYQSEAEVDIDGWRRGCIVHLHSIGSPRIVDGDGEVTNISLFAYISANYEAMWNYPLPYLAKRVVIKFVNETDYNVSTKLGVIFMKPYEEYMGKIHEIPLVPDQISFKIHVKDEYRRCRYYGSILCKICPANLIKCKTKVLESLKVRGG